MAKCTSMRCSGEKPQGGSWVDFAGDLFSVNSTICGTSTASVDEVVVDAENQFGEFYNPSDLHNAGGNTKSKNGSYLPRAYTDCDESDYGEILVNDHSFDGVSTVTPATFSPKKPSLMDRRYKQSRDALGAFPSSGDGHDLRRSGRRRRVLIGSLLVVTLMLVAVVVTVPLMITKSRNAEVSSVEMDDSGNVNGTNSPTNETVNDNGNSSSSTNDSNSTLDNGALPLQEGNTNQTMSSDNDSSTITDSDAGDADNTSNSSRPAADSDSNETVEETNESISDESSKPDQPAQAENNDEANQESIDDETEENEPMPDVPASSPNIFVPGQPQPAVESPSTPNNISPSGSIDTSDSGSEPQPAIESPTAANNSPTGSINSSSGSQPQPAIEPAVEYPIAPLDSSGYAPSPYSPPRTPDGPESTVTSDGTTAPVPVPTTEAPISTQTIENTPVNSQEAVVTSDSTAAPTPLPTTAAPIPLPTTEAPIPTTGSYAGGITFVSKTPPPTYIYSTPIPTYSVATPAPQLPTLEPTIFVSSVVRITLQTDKQGYETSWVLEHIYYDEARSTNSSTVIAAVDENTYASYEVDSREFTLQSGTYRFTLRDAFGDGFCCKDFEGYYSITVDGREIIKGGYYRSEISYDFLIGYFPEMTEREKEWVQAHNVRRKEWHEGNGVSYVPLRWSAGLAKEAQEWADELTNDCEIVGIEHEHDIEQGENLAKNRAEGRSGMGQLYPPDNILRRWVDREAELPNPQNLHLTQALWRASKYVGCADALREYEDGSVCRIQVCRYARAGNCQMGKYNVTEGENWLIPMLMDDTPCPPECPPEGCF